jgi:carboxypeptidase C (cathepsin A)
MRQLVTVCVTALSLLATAGTPVRAQDAPPPAKEQKQELATPQEEWSTTQHSIRVGSRTIPYTAKAGTTTITNEDGETTGLMYSVAYVRSDVSDRESHGFGSGCASPPPASPWWTSCRSCPSRPRPAR